MKYLITICACIIAVIAYAQPNNSYTGNVSMPSPRAASLGKYEDIPVSLSTGIPNINIPMFDISDGKVSTSVGLSYHSGGVKVGEPASNVGLGFSLVGGGMISRTILGVKDEAFEGYYYKGHEIPLSTDCTWSDHVSNAGQTPTMYESEPDVFTFNFNGYSGKFYFRNDSGTPEVVLIPKQDIRITPFFTTNKGDLNHLYGFEVITPDGMKYYFGDKTGAIDFIEVTQFNSGNSPKAVTGWYLNEISSYDDHYKIFFEYEVEDILLRFRKSAVLESGSTITPDFEDFTLIDGLRLKKIYNGSGTETIDFIYGAIREDIESNSSNDPRVLSKVRYSTGTGNIFQKSFLFTYDYWEDHTGNKYSIDSVNKRLKLLSLQEKREGTTTEVPPYEFSYYEDSNFPNYLPNRMSLAIDHWGYYNGASGNHNNSASLNIPAEEVFVMDGETCNVLTFPYGSTADRESNGAFMKYGTLNQIDYPLGGHVSFEFEANTYWGESLSQESVEMIIDGVWPFGLCYPRTFYPNNNPISFTSAELNTYVYEYQIAWSLSCNCNSGMYIGTSEIIAVDSNGDTLTSGQISLDCDDLPGTLPVGLISDLIPGLIPNEPYIFSLQTENTAAKFSIIDPGGSITYSNKEVGGLRIKKVTRHDDISTDNDIVKTYDYSSFSIPAQSSGKLFNKPDYSFPFTWWQCPSSCSFSFCDPCYPNQDLNFGGGTVFYFDNSIVPLGSFEGYHIEYANVTEKFKDNGKIQYLFEIESAPDFDDVFPVPPAYARVKSGKEIKSWTFSESNAPISNSEKVIDDNAYSYSNDNMFRVRYEDPFIFATPYKIRTNRFRYKEEKNILDQVETENFYTYDGNDDHGQVTHHVTVNSDGTEYRTRYEYPHNAANPISPRLIAKNIINIPIWTYEEFFDGSDYKQVGGDYNQFNIFNASGDPIGFSGNGEPYIFKYNEFEATWDASGVLSQNNYQLRATVNKYHANSSIGRGMPESVTVLGWSPETYEWENGVLKKKTYLNHEWSYNYYPGSKLLQSQIAIDGQVVSYEYDNLIRLSKIRERNNNVITDFEYNYEANSGIKNYVDIKKSFTPVAGSSQTNIHTRTYMDGLGREIQSINSSGLKDIANRIEYDNFGRVVEEYELVEGANSNASFITIPDTSPRTVSVYNLDPLGRIETVTPPDWYATTYEYGTNTGSQEVKFL